VNVRVVKTLDVGDWKHACWEIILQLNSIMFLKNVPFSLSFLAEEERLMLPYVAAVQISEMAQTAAPDNTVFQSCMW